MRDRLLSWRGGLGDVSEIMPRPLVVTDLNNPLHTALATLDLVIASARVLSDTAAHKAQQQDGLYFRGIEHGTRAAVLLLEDARTTFTVLCASPRALRSSKTSPPQAPLLGAPV